MYFGELNSDVYFASVTAVMNAIFCYIGLRYNITPLYLDHFNHVHTWWVLLVMYECDI